MIKFRSVWRLKNSFSENLIVNKCNEVCEQYNRRTIATQKLNLTYLELFLQIHISERMHVLLRFTTLHLIISNCCSSRDYGFFL